MPAFRVRQAVPAGVGILVLLFVAGCGRQTAQAPTPATVAPPAMAAPAGSSAVGTSVGMIAPDFTTTTTAGKPLSLQSLRGKVVLVDYWATWCGPCKMSMPTLEALHRRFGPQGLKVVGISVDDPSSVSQVPAVTRELGVTYTIAASPQEDGLAQQAYNVNGIPAQFLIDKKGVLRWTQDGFSFDEKQQLSTLIQQLLAEKA